MAKKMNKKMFLERLGALMVKTHISTFSNPYLNRKRYGSQEVEIWVSAEWSEMSRHKNKRPPRMRWPFIQTKLPCLFRHFEPYAETGVRF